MAEVQFPLTYDSPSGFQGGFYLSDKYRGSRTINVGSVGYTILQPKLTGFAGAKLWCYPRFLVTGYPGDLDQTAWYKKGYRLGSFRYLDGTDVTPSEFIDRESFQLPPMKYWINLRTDKMFRWTQYQPLNADAKWFCVSFGIAGFNQATGTRIDRELFPNAIFADKIEIITQPGTEWQMQLSFMFFPFALPTVDPSVTGIMLMPF